MLRKLIGPMIFGIGGAAILVSLGVWQVQRLAWKVLIPLSLVNIVATGILKVVF